MSQDRDWDNPEAESSTLRTIFSYWLFPSDDSNEHTLRFVCPLEKFDEVRALFPSKANIDQFTRREGDTVEVRINARLTRAELNNLISTHIHNSSVHAIDLVDEPGS